MKQFKKKEFAIIPTKVKMATKANKPSINAISMNEPMKVVMNFGRNKTEYDELPSGRKYLTPSEIVAIQELNLDDKSPLGTVRDAFTPNRSLEKASCHFLMTAIRKTALYMLDS